MQKLIEFFNTIWDPAATTAGAIAAALATHLWRRFRRRLVPLRWSANHQLVAGAGTDATLGTVEVRHNNVVVNHLQLVSVQLENASSIDQKDLTIQFSYVNGPRFLGGGGSLRGSLAALPWGDAFQENIDALLALNPDEVNEEYITYFNTRRDLKIPVLNRGTVADFVFLIDVPEGCVPELLASCDHVGVRLVHEPPRQILWGVPVNQALAVGLFVGIALAVVLPVFGAAGTALSLAAFGVGAFVTIIGVLVVKLGRLLVRLLS